MYKIEFKNKRDKWIVLIICILCYVVGLYTGVFTNFVSFSCECSMVDYTYDMLNYTNVSLLDYNNTLI